MSGIRLVEVDEATIETPPAGRVTVFADEATHLPSFKDDAGDVHALEGPQGDPGSPGAPGDDGVGVPAGGTTGQVLAKASNTDHDTEWADAATGGGLTQAYVGKNAIGASWETVTHRRMYAKKITLAEARLLTAIEAYLQLTVTAAKGVQAHLMSDNGSGTAPDLVLSSARFEQTVWNTSDPRWFGFAIGRWLAAGDYWIVVQPNVTDSADLQIAYDGSGSDLRMTPNFGEQSGDWGIWTTGTDSRDYSIRANTIR